MGDKQLTDLAVSIALGQTPADFQGDLTAHEWRRLVRTLESICERAGFAAMYVEGVAVPPLISQQAAVRRAERASGRILSALGYNVPGG